MHRCPECGLLVVEHWVTGEDVEPDLPDQDEIVKAFKAIGDLPADDPVRQKVVKCLEPNASDDQDGVPPISPITDQDRLFRPDSGAGGGEDKAGLDGGHKSDEVGPDGRPHAQ